MSSPNREACNVKRGAVAPPPFVSLIIPTRNCRAELSRLLDSIERQTFRDLEVIVLDNENTFECGKQLS